MQRSGRIHSEEDRGMCDRDTDGDDTEREKEGSDMCVCVCVCNKVTKSGCKSYAESDPGVYKKGMLTSSKILM